MDQLSLAGRITLAKSVIGTIPTYSMMTMQIPTGVVKDIEKIQRSFVWGHNTGNRKLHPISWKVLCSPKANGGGGIKNLHLMNTACLMKQAWHLKSEQDSIWSRVVQSKYKRQADWGRCLEAKSTDSRCWRDIAKASESLSSFELWRVGDGETINIWTDSWIENNFHVANHARGNILDTWDWTVSDLLNEQGHWDWKLIDDLFDESVKRKILAYPPPSQRWGKDRISWGGEASGVFTIRSAYNLLMNCERNPDPQLKAIWKIPVIERIRTFIWILCHNRLPSKIQCQKWSRKDSRCNLCQSANETAIHIVRDCPFACSIWNKMVSMQRRSDFYGGDNWDWISKNLKANWSCNKDWNWTALWATTCWFLWNWRNKDIHDPLFKRPPNPHLTIISFYEMSQASQVLPKSCPPAKSIKLISWQPPHKDWIKVNTDGTRRQANGIMEAGCGGLMRDHHGSWQGGFSKKLGDTGIAEAEAWGDARRP